jgi:diguanylate cyclase (GGDEF)-like protein/PAS domain S-box-containing protein
MKRNEALRLYAFVSAVTAVGLGALGSAVLASGHSHLFRPSAELAMFSCFLLIGELFALQVPRRGEEGDEITTSTTFSFALLLSAGAPVAVAVQAIASLLADARRHKAWWKAAFNVAQYTIALTAAGKVLAALTDLRPTPTGIPITTRHLPAILAAGAVYFLLNNSIIGTALALAQRIPILAYLRRDFPFQVVPASVLLAFAPIVVIIARVSLPLLTLLIAPMLFVYKSARIALDHARSEQRFGSLVQNAADVIMVLDRVGTFRYLSPSVLHVLGREPKALLRKPVSELVHPDDLATALHARDEALRGGGKEVRSEFRCRTTGGRWVSFEALWTDLLEDPAVCGIVVNCRDITDRKALEDQLTHQAFHDPLTGLANRALFEDRVTHALSRAARRSDPLAVLFLDLDNFKTINDSLGHAAGDELLVDVAARLRSCVRPSDTAARLGGDEFGVAIEDHADASDVTRIANRILEALAAPFSVRGKEITVRASIGVAVSAQGREETHELLRNADVAMYVAKGRGKGRHEVFEASMHEEVVERLELGADLQRALERGELTLEFQPTVRLQGESLVGFEALLRWQHPIRGAVSPVEFIPLAEETGLILPIGRWVIYETCRYAKAWQDAAVGAPATVSLNLSPRQLKEPDLVTDIAGALAETGLDPRLLVLEITESVMMEDTDTAVERLHQLRNLGIRVALDDFGTGYSSLSYLRRLPIDMLKIDMSFVEGLGERSEQAALTRAIIGLGSVLGLVTVAEGIETPEQLRMLRDMGCDMGQGFLFSRPLAAGEATSLVTGSRLPVDLPLGA